MSSSFTSPIIDAPASGVSIFFATIAVSIVAFFWWTWPNKIPKGVAGPVCNIPYFGGAFETLKNFDNMPDYFAEANITYGGRTWAFPMPNIGLLPGSLYVISSPEAVKHILSGNFKNYVKGEQVREVFKELLGEGIFTSDGAVWKFHRKVASHMFSVRLLRESTAVAAQHALRLVRLLKQKASSSAGIVVDMQDMYFRLTMDVFTFISFGVDLESVTRESQHPFAVAFDAMQLHSERRYYNPLWKVARALPFLSEGEREIASGTKVVNDFAAKVISGRRRTLQGRARDLTSSTSTSTTSKNDEAEEEERALSMEGLQLGPDLLSRFLEDAAKKDTDDQDGGGHVGSEARTGGTDQELKDIVLNFMIAGRDTTACALSWTLYELAKAQATTASGGSEGEGGKVVQRLRQEFGAAFPTGTFDDLGNGNKATVTGAAEDDCEARNKAWYEKVSGLDYAHAVTMEVLRLHPSVPKDLKYAVENDVLPDGTAIPAGSPVMWCPYAMGRDKNIWGDDALEFKPSRFLEGGSRGKEPSAFAYPVFNAGPRLCLGKPLALMEIKLITGLLLQAFDFELAVPHIGGYTSTLVLPMSPGLLVKLTPRAGS